MPQRLSGVGLAAAFSLMAPLASALAAPRVVAVGDLHGDLAGALSVLQMTSLVDTGGKWIGGDAILVQTGDVTDRGPDSKAILDLLRRLGAEAAADGGRVVPLLGNHEVMNLQGDWRYVHPGDIDAFGGAEARADALSPLGDYGRWLRERDVVARVGDDVFVHGGVSPRWAELGVDGLNRVAREALDTPSHAVVGGDGPLWYRALVVDAENSACSEVALSLESLGARRMVVGHTTRRDGRIQVRCGGQLVVIDTGIASAYGGHLAALELVDGDARAIYPTGAEDLEDPAP